MTHERVRATQAVIFDLWGTLVPYPAAAGARVVESMAEILCIAPDVFGRAWAADFDLRATGDLEASLHRVCRFLAIAPPAEVINEALARRVSFHRACFTPRADAVPALEKLRSLGLRLGLITDCTSEVPALWAESSLAALVDVPVFSCEERIKKPDRRIYEIACSHLGVATLNCVYVGDGGSDELVGATAVGIRAIQLLAPDAELHAWEGEKISSLSELPQLVAR